MKLRLLAGVLLIISAFTRSLQVFVYGGVWRNLAAAAYGAMYLFLGVVLIRYLKTKGLVFLCIALPLIGGVNGVIRFLFLHTETTNLFIVLHILIDIVLVPTSILILNSMRTSLTTTVEQI